MHALQQITVVSVLGIGLAILSGETWAQQEYPTKPIRIVVGNTPGGPLDILARLIGPQITDHWGQPVVIENRRLSGPAVANATPDGYTMLMAGPGLSIRQVLYEDRAFNLLTALAGVTTIGNSNTVVVVSPALGVKSVKELAAFAHAQPIKIFFASPAAGGVEHLNAERFRLALGIKAQHVSYKGIAECLIEVVSGRAHFTAAALTAAMPFIKDGKLVALVQRVAALPGVPLAADVLPEWKQIGGNGIFVPAGTPLAIRHRLSKEFARVFNLPEIRERLASVAYHIELSTPEEHDRRVREDMAAFAKLVKQIGLKQH